MIGFHSKNLVAKGELLDDRHFKHTTQVMGLCQRTSDNFNITFALFVTFLIYF